MKTLVICYNQNHAETVKNALQLGDDVMYMGYLDALTGHRFEKVIVIATTMFPMRELPKLQKMVDEVYALKLIRGGKLFVL